MDKGVENLNLKDIPIILVAKHPVEYWRGSGAPGHPSPTVQMFKFF